MQEDTPAGMADSSTLRNQLAWSVVCDAEIRWALAKQRPRDVLEPAEREALQRQCEAHQPQRPLRALRERLTGAWWVGASRGAGKQGRR